MRVTLIVNPEAGDGDEDGRKLAAKLGRRGDVVTAVSSKSDDFKTALEDPGELVAVAGGDGTVKKVVRRLVGRITPIHLLPTGTANNIASSLGIKKMELDLDVVRAKWRAKPMDVAMTDEGQVIVEAAGCGAIADVIRMHADPEREGPVQEARNLGEYMEKLEPFDYRITFNGTEITGQALIVEAMVIKQVGPNLCLAPRADPSDGLLDLIIANDGDRAQLQRYLASGARKYQPELQAIRGASFTISCKGPWHFDGKLKPRRDRTITARAAAWQAMLPPKTLS